ncbi:hypothetical protein BDR04DRAFT_1146037 [Suillus decipiens]|nr:hypothetical protein BDR04DRAFT_1146037 [Suillus decipiens]
MRSDVLTSDVSKYEDGKTLEIINSTSPHTQYHKAIITAANKSCNAASSGLARSWVDDPLEEHEQVGPTTKLRILAFEKHKKNIHRCKLDGTVKLRKRSKSAIATHCSTPDFLVGFYLHRDVHDQGLGLILIHLDHRQVELKALIERLAGTVKVKNSPISAIRPVFSMSHATQINLLRTRYRKYSPGRVKWLFLGSGRYPEKQPTISSYHPSIVARDGD